MKKIWGEIEFFPVTEQRLVDKQVAYRHRNRRNKKEIGKK